MKTLHDHLQDLKGRLNGAKADAHAFRKSIFTPSHFNFFDRSQDVVLMCKAAKFFAQIFEAFPFLNQIEITLQSTQDTVSWHLSNLSVNSQSLLSSSETAFQMTALLAGSNKIAYHPKMTVLSLFGVLQSQDRLYNMHRVANPCLQQNTSVISLHRHDFNKSTETADLAKVMFTRWDELVEVVVDFREVT